ncbi:MAG: serine/threonine protein kinase [Polyangiaceae bacterium]|jgi:serine/threonine-protein kinase|nr:serine/threonine protein kinase [Polyangiaceae bacterium]
MPTGSTSLNAGDTLGSYQLLIPIGEGGMGRVWVARERETGAFARYVAIKTALAEYSSNQKFWTALVDEAHIASSLRHPNVCVIHAVETEGTVVYLVMDWSDAGSLREVLDGAEGERIAPSVAARIIASVCAGLHAAHELKDEHGAALGVVHRDVSPQNILLSTSGQVKVADFGVAKARGQLQEATRTGELKGKLSYMAPEQVTLKAFDRRADIFALGCVLYEATLGKRPFHGNDALATLYSLLEQPLTKPSELDPNYPEGLEQVVLKALAREPGDRYQTAEELGYALESWLGATRTIVTEANVAQLIRETLGEQIKERKLLLDETVRRLDAGELLEDELGHTSSAPTQLGMSTQTGGSQLAKRSSAPLFVGATLLAAAGAALWFGVGRGERPAAVPEPPVASSPVIPAAVASPPPVVPHAPAAPSVEPRAAQEPDGVTRSPNGKARPPRVVAGRPPAAQPAGAAPAAQAPAPPTRAPGELPTVIEKAPRSLDADNPFAK